MFIKGGIMYYQPITKSLSAFENKLIENDNQILNISKFDLDFITSDQFVNMINSYCHSKTLSSENILNKLINYLKDNYTEVRKEKDMKLSHVRNLFMLFGIFWTLTIKPNKIVCRFPNLKLNS